MKFVSQLNSTVGQRKLPKMTRTQHIFFAARTEYYEPFLRVPYTFSVKCDRGYFFLVKRDLSFYLFVIRDRPSPDHFYVHVKAVLELSVTHGQTFELNVIRELNCFV